MKKIVELPDSVKDIVRRRLQSATTTMIRGAFGEDKVSVNLWRDEDHVFIYLSNTRLTDEANGRNLIFGTPFPFIQMRSDDEEYPAAAISFKLSRMVSLERISIEGIDYLAGIGPSSSIMIKDCDIIRQSGSVHIATLFAFHLGERLSWEQALGDFENFVVKCISPFVQRIADAAE